MRHIHIHIYGNKRATRDEWNESDHPRADNGQFGSGGGESPASSHKLTAERGKYDWLIKNEKGDIVGKYPTSYSKSDALKKHEEETKKAAEKKAAKKAAAPAEKEKKEAAKKVDAELKSAMSKHEYLIKTAHTNANLKFHPLSKEDFNSKQSVLLHSSPKYGKTQGSEYRLIMVNGKPAYARESNHWGAFGTAEYENGERVEKEHNWELPGVKTEWGNKERFAGYVLLEDLPGYNKNGASAKDSAFFSEAEWP